MAEWIKPIYDRTKTDIDYAKKQMKHFKAIDGITDGVDLKGCLNYADLNRIESDIEYLSEHLIDLYYFNVIDKRSLRWTMADIPTKKEIDRIINNIAEIWSKYYTPENSPELPKTMVHYEEVNNIEKCLFLLRVMLDDMVSRFRECNDGLECGED